MASTPQTESEFYKFLKGRKEIATIEALEKGPFAEKYVVEVVQPLDHDSGKGSFTQRVIIGHVHKDSINLLGTAGYVGDYALAESSREEISKELNTNQFTVEHRYFSGSTPDPVDWTYMTGYNAAGDMHRITNMLKEFYGKRRWVATGISKGGQNSIIYRTYYPDDVDVSVPYVAPICKGLVDGRHEPFIDQIGTQKSRDRILEYQRAVLSNRKEIVPMLEAYAKREGQIYKVGYDEVLDYCVLEMPFSTWQWCNSIDAIPTKESSSKELFDYLIKHVNPSYFTETSTQPFFVQAAKELGYYGYDTKPLKDLLSIKSSKGYFQRMFLGEDLDLEFNDQTYKDVYKYLGNNDPKMMFIYGEYDPWSAARIPDRFFEGKENMTIFIEPEGSHKARINTLSSGQRTRAWNQLREWLK